MDLIQFPFERVVEINLFILKTEPGHKGVIDIAKLQGALGRIDNSIADAHAFSDANKRTALAVCLEYLSLNDFELTSDNELLADAVRDLVIGEIDETDFADILYSQFTKDHQNR